MPTDGRLSDLQAHMLELGLGHPAKGLEVAERLQILAIRGGEGTIEIGTSSSALAIPSGSNGATMYFSSTSTSGSTSIESLYCKMTMSGAGGVGGRARFHLYTNVSLGGWANALKAYTEFGSSGRITGLASALCAEMVLPNANLGSGGAYMPLEVELVYGGTSVVSAGGLGGNHVAFATYRFSGDTDGDFDDNGFFYTVAGLTAGAAHVLSADSHTLKVGIGTATTRYLFLSQIENGLGIGASGSAVSFSQGSPLFALYSTCSSTNGSNSVESFYCETTLTGAAGVGGRARFYMTTNVALGGWSNALKAHVVYGDSGKTTGLGSALCAELELSQGTTSGSYAPLESELICVSGDSTGTCTSFLYCNTSGSGAGTLDDNAVFFEIGSGITAGSGHLFQASDVDAPDFTHALKVKIDGTLYYIGLSTSAAFDA